LQDARASTDRFVLDFLKQLFDIPPSERNDGWGAKYFAAAPFSGRRGLGIERITP
jgi:hypothetical protein